MKVRTVIAYFKGVHPIFGSVKRFDQVTEVWDNPAGLRLVINERDAIHLKQDDLGHYQVIYIAD